jgi:hypothetical protein
MKGRNGMKLEVPGVPDATETQETPETLHSGPEGEKIVEQPDEGTARVERLLRHASSWNPEAGAPEDLARQALANRGLLRGRSRGSVRAQPWWGMSTVGLAAAATILLYVQGALPMVNAPDYRPASLFDHLPPVSYFPPAQTKVLGIAASEGTRWAAMNVSHRYTADRGTLTFGRNAEEDREGETFSTEVRPVRSQNKASASNSSWRGSRSPRSRPMPVAAVDTTPERRTEKPPVVRWEVEAPPPPSYRMYVPVVMTDEVPQEGDSSVEVTGTPGVMEVAFDPSLLMPQDQR